MITAPRPPSTPIEVRGEKGDAGKNGRGISSLTIVDGSLIVTYTDGTSVNVGKVQGVKGIQGTMGEQGLQGPKGTVTVEVYRNGKLDETTSDVRSGSTVRVKISSKKD